MLAKATFRQSFPEFADAAVYPDSMLDFWLVVSNVHCSETKWAALFDVGMSLCLAHHLKVAKDAGDAGLVSSESAGDVSVSLDTSSTTEERGGNWNLTTYGKQFIRMARLVGGCAMQL